jgi:hypothetical protein
VTTAKRSPSKKARSASPKRAARASKPKLNRWQSTGALSERQRAKVPNGLEPPPPVPERDPVRPPIPAGARVRMTGEFLRNTGQIAGGEGQRVWKVRSCDCMLCAGGRFVAVNERSAYDYGSADKPWRHIAIGNLEDLDRLARQEEAGRLKLLEKEKVWKGVFAKAEREKRRALIWHGRESHQFKRACERIDFFNVARARLDSDVAFIEATGKEPWYFSRPGPLDMVRIATKGEMVEPTGIDEIGVRK